MSQLHNLDLLIAFVAAIALTGSDVDQARFALGFAAFGGVFGSWGGSIINPAKSLRQASLRALVNFCIALTGGPAIGYWLGHLFPDVPLYACIMASALILGMMGVYIITMIIPKLIARISSKNEPKDSGNGR